MFGISPLHIPLNVVGSVKDPVNTNGLSPKLTLIWALIICVSKQTAGYNLPPTRLNARPITKIRDGVAQGTGSYQWDARLLWRTPSQCRSWHHTQQRHQYHKLGRNCSHAHRFQIFFRRRHDIPRILYPTLTFCVRVPGLRKSRRQLFWVMVSMNTSRWIKAENRNVTHLLGPLCKIVTSK